MLYTATIYNLPVGLDKKSCHRALGRDSLGYRLKNLPKPRNLSALVLLKDTEQ
jgi:hypothetical protein